MNLPQRLIERLIDIWQPLLAGIVGGLFTVGLLTFQLGSLVPALSAPEAQSLHDSHTLHQLINNPLNLPYKLLVYCLSSWGHATPFSLRLISAVFGLLIVGLFYYALRQWYAPRTAILGTALLASSSWFLHIARLATPDILYAMVVAVLAYGAWIRKTKHPLIAIWVGSFLTIFLLYIPGLVWLALLGVIWQRKAILNQYKHHAFRGFLAILVSFGLLLPLLYALSIHPKLIRTYMGLQNDVFTHPQSILHRLLSVPNQLFLHGRLDAVLSLGRLPLLDIFAITMLFLGIYAHYFMKELDRTRLLFVAIVAGAILISLGVVPIILLLPFIYALITGGIAFMLEQWFSIFPRNPLARLIGASLMSIAIILTMFYHINNYFIAWPNNPQTKQSFQIHL